MLLQLGEPLVELAPDRAHRDAHLVGRGDVMPRGEKDDLLQRFLGLAADRVEAGEPVDLVAEEFHAHRVLRVGGAKLDGVAANAEPPARELEIVALVLHFDQTREEVFPGQELPLRHGTDHVLVVLGRAQAVDARDAGDDDDVAAGEERAGGGEAQALDLLVDARVLFDVGVAARNVGLGLVVIEVGDEILDGVFGKELLELAVELRGESLVVREDERGPVERRDDVGHGERLARAGDAEQRGMLFAGAQPLQQLVDGLRLIAQRRIGADELEGHHSNKAVIPSLSRDQPPEDDRNLMEADSSTRMTECGKSLPARCARPGNK